MVLSRYWSCFWVATIGGWLFGYNQGIIGGVSGPMTKMFHADMDTESSEFSVYQGLLTAEILVGAFAGSIIGVPVAHKYGRRRALVVCGALCILACALLAMPFIEEFWTIIAVRTLLGVPVGFTCVVCPMYVSENAPVESRNQLGSVFQVAICASIFVAQVLNYLFNSQESSETIDAYKYHWQFGLGAIAGLALIPLTSVIPESETFESSHSLTSSPTRFGDEFDNRDLPLTRPVDPFEGDLVVPRASVVSSSASSSSSSSSSKNRVGWSAILSCDGLRYIGTAVVLAMCNQLTGINGIIFYAPTILKDAGISPSLVLILTFVLVGGWNLASVFLSLLFIDRLSRRTLMLGALSVMATAAALLGISAAGVFGSSGKTLVSLGSILLFIGAFEFGPGPLFFPMALEAFPPHVQQQALSLTNSICWSFNILVTFIFPVLDSALGNTATYLLLAGIGALTICGVLVFLPKGEQQAELLGSTALASDAEAANAAALVAGALEEEQAFTARKRAPHESSSREPLLFS